MDQGLQAERTLLAWNRSALAAFVNAGLLLRGGWMADRPGLLFCGALMLLLAGVTCLMGWRRAQKYLPGTPPLSIGQSIIHSVCSILVACCLLAALSAS